MADSNSVVSCMTALTSLGVHVTDISEATANFLVVLKPIRNYPARGTRRLLLSYLLCGPGAA
jgi:hypothetical protein